MVAEFNVHTVGFILCVQRGLQMAVGALRCPSKCKKEQIIRVKLIIDGRISCWCRDTFSSAIVPFHFFSIQFIIMVSCAIALFLLLADSCECGWQNRLTARTHTYARTSHKPQVIRSEMGNNDEQNHKIEFQRDDEDNQMAYVPERLNASFNVRCETKVRDRGKSYALKCQIENNAFRIQFSGRRQSVSDERRARVCGRFEYTNECFEAYSVDRSGVSDISNGVVGSTCVWCGKRKQICTRFSIGRRPTTDGRKSGKCCTTHRCQYVMQFSINECTCSHSETHENTRNASIQIRKWKHPTLGA